jgi:hypothetical protein
VGILLWFDVCWRYGVVGWGGVWGWGGGGVGVGGGGGVTAIYCSASRAYRRGEGGAERAVPVETRLVCVL